MQPFQSPNGWSHRTDVLPGHTNAKQAQQGKCNIAALLDQHQCPTGIYLPKSFCRFFLHCSGKWRGEPGRISWPTSFLRAVSIGGKGTHGYSSSLELQVRRLRLRVAKRKDSTTTWEPKLQTHPGPTSCLSRGTFSKPLKCSATVFL